mmetsp:Transcript_90348/g.256088  ORF Transcript_90348/g.256088 Transcript_90348/m.256088 type:complete len:263 (-) Transcript_90348:22-810(-)
MVHVENHEGVDRLHGHGVQLVLLHGRGEHHVQEVFRERVLRLGVHDGPADGGLVGHGREHGYLRDEPHAGQPSVLRVRGVQLAEDAAQGAYNSDHDRHRVRVHRERREHRLDLFMDQHLLLDLPGEVPRLGLVRELADEQQVGHLQRGRPLAEVRDRVPAVEADPRGPVRVGDGRHAGPGAGEAGVEGEVARLRVEVADVEEDVVPVRGLQHLDLVLAAVRQREGRHLLLVLLGRLRLRCPHGRLGANAGDVTYGTPAVQHV